MGDVMSTDRHQGTLSAIGLIGYGEAGSLIAGGLARSNPQLAVWVLDPVLAGEPAEGPRRAKAAAARINVARDLAELAAKADLILCTVTAAVAVKVADDAAARLGPQHVYVDLNSVAPATKKKIGEIVARAGAKFVEGAIMTNVAKKQHQVPIFACGPGIDAFLPQAASLGMAVEGLGPELGRASATKMFRSIMVKGMEALFLECLWASSEYGVGDKVLEMVQEGYPGMDWKALADQLVGRTAEHGARRADEMKEVAATLRVMGIEPYMAAAAAQRIASCGDAMKGHFTEGPPASYHQAMAIVRDAVSRQRLAP
jgi:3-hydroxyisobutyrate dehydrogenase-like beta-hydroxyacid dehydrogenase